MKFLISGSLAKDTNITTAPIIDKLELIPLMARVQSGMVALARPMNGDDVTGVVTFTAGESVIYVTDMIMLSLLPGKTVHATFPGNLNFLCLIIRSHLKQNDLT